MVIECKSTKNSSTKEYAQYSSSSERRPRFTQSKFAIRNSNVPQLRAYEQPAVELPESNDKVFYKLVGACYVHKMISGELIDYQSVEKRPRTVFEIR